MKHIILLTILLTLTISLTGCKKSDNAARTNPPANPGQIAQTQAPNGAPAIPTKLGDPAPGIMGLTWVKNGPVEYQKGRVYVIEFWATWCGPCRASIPHLTEVQKKFAGKNVTVVGISDEKLDEVKPFVDSMGDTMNYAVAIDPEKTMNKYYMEPFKARGIPHAFIIDQNGLIAWQGHPMDDMDKVLEKILQGSFNIAAWSQLKEELEVKAKQIRADYTAYFAKVKEENGKEPARAIATRLINAADSNLLNSFAWDILTALEAPYRDPEIALQAAAKANTIAEGKNAAILDTYALALFQSGKIDEAIDQQRKAVQLSQSNPQLAGEMQKTLDKYLSTKG